jgi:carbamoyl-phosphate synthase large subunit
VPRRRAATSSAGWSRLRPGRLTVDLATMVDHGTADHWSTTGRRTISIRSVHLRTGADRAAGHAEPRADGGHMPKRDDITSVLVIGSSPIVIGQGCEFDYSGTQACRALSNEGIRVSLVNPNPATIMTDPELADATYTEPITLATLERVIAIERPDAMLPTLGGQIALKAALDLAEVGILRKYNVELIGANVGAIRAGQDRERFQEIVNGLGASVPRGLVCRTVDDCMAAVNDVAGLCYPVAVRPAPGLALRLGGSGSGVARDAAELRRIAGAGLESSPVREVLLEESILGWKEFELELMRDRDDNIAVVCSIEYIDPIGVHPGDRVAVAPAMTLSDRGHQQMRDTATSIIRAVGVDTGGCNIRFATDPRTGRMAVIEMNPRLSRSSALASKATGFPIAKIAAKLAVGYTLDEVANGIAGEGLGPSGSALDHVAVKVPRFAFEKFPGADPMLTTHMKSVGESMAIGRSFCEAMQKAQRSLETSHGSFTFEQPGADANLLLEGCRTPHDGRLGTVQKALLAGATVADVHKVTGVDTWFLEQIQKINEMSEQAAAAPSLDRATLLELKSAGFSDAQIAQLRGCAESEVRGLRWRLGLRPVYHAIGARAEPFAAGARCLYSTYGEGTEVPDGERPKVIILGSGPNRIGQGIEFDYACVHASSALAAAGYETVMVNCNPEAVSTDYDTSGRLYLEPLTLEDVLEVVYAEQRTGPLAGVVVQLGGQTSLCLARELEAAGVPVAGTPSVAIHRAEDREEFAAVLAAAGLTAPRHGTARSADVAAQVAAKIGYPVLVRPSYVPGGRGAEVVHEVQGLREYVSRATEVPVGYPMLIDRFLRDAIEIDVDALYDGRELYLGGVMEHIEEAGIHSGDSACALPPVTLPRGSIDQIRAAAEAIAAGVGVRGLLNVQYALAAGMLYVLEASPRASRTIPFVSKATGTPLAKAAARIMLGETIADLRRAGLLPASGDGGEFPLDAPVAVKEAVLPFGRFHDANGRCVDTVLGPQMRSTGDVMGIAASFGSAFAKAQAAVYGVLPITGRVLASIANRDKRAMIFPVKRLSDLGFEIWATEGTAQVLRRNGIRATVVRKHSAGPGADGEPTAVSRILGGEVDLIVNTPSGSRGQPLGQRDGYEIRTAAIRRGVMCVTTVSGLAAVVQGIEAEIRGDVSVRSLQLHTGELMTRRHANQVHAPGDRAGSRET